MSFCKSDPHSPRDYFSVQKTILKFIGIRFDRNQTVWRCLFVILLVVSYSCIEAMELVKNLNDFDVFTNIILHLIGFYVAISKVIVLFCNSQKVKDIFDAMESETYDGEEEEIIRKAILQSSKQTAYCLVPLNAVFFSAAVATLLRKMVVGAENLPFTQLSIVVGSDAYFVLMWLHQTVAFVVGSMAYMGTEILITAILAHTCVQFKILKMFIEKNADRGRSTRSLKRLNDGLGGEYLKAIVRRHIDLYSLAKKVQDAFRLIVLVMLASDVLIICFSAFHASLYPLNDMQCLRDVGIALSVITKDLIVCYWGNEVRFESQTIASTCYEAHFEDKDLSLQKGLLLVILRSQKPIIIAAGKLVPLSLDTFIWIVKTSYSYFAVLKSRNAALQEL